MKKRKIINFLVLFLALILCGTILSRASTNLLTAKVEMGYIESGTISHVINAQGVVEGKEKVAVIVEKELQIEAIHIEKGQNIEKNDKILTVNLVKLEEAIRKIQQDIEVLEYQIKDAISARNTDKRNSEITYNQAVEEYNYTVTNEKEKVDKALHSLQDAQTEYNNYVSESEIDEEKKAQLLAVIQEKEDAYQTAIETHNVNIHAVEKGIQAVNIETADNSIPEQLEISKNSHQIELDKLIELKENEGIIRSTASGKVNEILVEIGGQTPETAIALIEDKRDGGKAIIQIEYAEAAFVKVGDEIHASLSTLEGTEKTICTIGDIERDEEDNNILNVTIMIPPDTLELGSFVDFEIKGKTAEYQHTLPIGAIHQEGVNKYYILGVKENKTIVGNELEVVKHIVKVIDKNREKVAIEGAIDNQEVILSSDKVLQEGSKVQRKG